MEFAVTVTCITDNPNVNTKIERLTAANETAARDIAEYQWGKARIVSIEPIGLRITEVPQPHPFRFRSNPPETDASREHDACFTCGRASDDPIHTQPMRHYVVVSAAGQCVDAEFLTVAAARAVADAINAGVGDSFATVQEA